MFSFVSVCHSVDGGCPHPYSRRLVQTYSLGDPSLAPAPRPAQTFILVTPTTRLPGLVGKRAVGLQLKGPLVSTCLRPQAVMGAKFTALQTFNVQIYEESVMIKKVAIKQIEMHTTENEMIK